MNYLPDAVVNKPQHYEVSRCHSTGQSVQVPHWDAKLYKANSVKLQQTTALEVLNEVSFVGHESVLDVGCGDGKITQAIAQRVLFGMVHGIDLSEGMIDLAKQDFSDVKNLSFSVMNAEDLHFTSKFDKIFGFFCLQWVPDKLKAFLGISEHLKDGGQVTLIVTDRNPHLLAVRTEMYAEPKWSPYFENYKDPTDVIDDSDYENYVKMADLKLVEFRETPRTYFFDSADETKVFVKMVSPQVKQVPESFRDEFLEELASSYLEKAPFINGTKNYIQYKIRVIKAEK